MDLNPEKIIKVAKLAKINLSEKEVTLFSQQFQAIADVIIRLQHVNTKDIQPVHNPSFSNCLLRSDLVTEGNIAEDVLINAPKAAFNCFVVPKVVE